MVRIIEEAGVDAIHVSTGVYGCINYFIPPASIPHGFLLSDAEEIKKSVKIPVIAVGRINDPLMAEDALLRGKADMIAMGRQALADPEYPNKVFARKEREIAPCIGCLQGCVGYVLDPVKLKVSCMVNPFCGKESEMKITPADTQKKVIIVGGGPAGLEAAWVAAKRGHDVTLYEKSGKLGGNFRIAAIPPAKQEILNAIEYYKVMGDKYGVDYQLNVDVTEEMILEKNPDVVILATGGAEIIPNIPGVNQENVFTSSQVLTGEKDPVGKVLVIGGGMVGCETADFLGEYGCGTTIVEMLDDVAMDVQAAVRYYLMERLERYKVAIETKTKVKEIKKNSVIVEKEGKETELTGFDAIIVSVGYKPVNNLQAKLEGKVQLHIIGDAVKTRKAIEGIYEAANVALEI